jgi:hypothetical protein
MTEKKKPYIIQFESEDFYRAVTGLILFDLGLEMNKTAADFRQADVLVKQIEEKKLDADLAVIDTLLEREHFEGEQIAAALKAANPKIKIIAYTILPEDQTWADYTAIKSNRDPNRTLIKGFETLLGVSKQEK